MIAHLSLAVAAAVQLPVEGKLAQIDRTFVCPESLPTDEARLAAVQVFLAQVQEVEPNLTIDALVRYRQRLLVSHGCRETLRNQQQNAKPARRR